MEQDQYIKLFNYGYFLSKHEPQILDQLLKTAKTQPELQEPLEAGKLQRKKELYRARFQKPQRAKSQDLEMGIE